MTETGHHQAIRGTGVAGLTQLTPRRRAVLEALLESRDHPTAAELYQRVRARLPGIGAATVYRALARLVESGLAVELALGDGAARYDGNVARHDHLICLGCDRVVDVIQPPPDLSGLADTGFVVTGYDLRILGLCPACRRRGTWSAGDTAPSDGKTR